MNQRKRFFKGFKIFSPTEQSVPLVLLQGRFEKADIQFKCNHVLRNEDGEY